MQHLAKVLSTVINVSHYCIEQALRNDGQDSAILVAFTSLCIRGNAGWLQSPDAAPLVSSMLYCSRLLSLLVQLTHFELWDPSTLCSSDATA